MVNHLMMDRLPIVTKLSHNIGNSNIRTIEFTVAIPGDFTKKGILQAISNQLKGMMVPDEAKEESISKTIENLINKNRINQ